MTVPVTPSQSPSDKAQNSSKRGVELARANTWMRPLGSASVPNAALPWTRRSSMRPATDTVSSVFVPSASSPYRSWRSAAVAVRSKR